MKKLLLFLLLIVCSSVNANANAQNSDVYASINEIKSDTSYYYGESKVFSSQERASNESIGSLYSNIAKNSSSYILYFGSDDPMKYLENIIKTSCFRHFF